MDGGNVMAIQDPLTELIIGCCFRVAADLLVERRVLVEVKATHALGNADVAQGLNYMRGTRLETCLLVNFGRAKIQVRRLGMTRAAATGDVELEVKDVQ